MQRDWPAAMTVLSTHDTKRSADARARLAVLAELPELWRTELAAWTSLSAHPLDPHTAYLLFQTALAAWPVDGDRLAAAMLKSVREAKLRTTWTEPDTDYEQAVERAARALPDTAALTARIDAFVDLLAPHTRVNTLSSTLCHLTMPGVPDLYQGSEFPLRTLVDPDNRRIVDFDALPPPGTLAAEKLHLTTVALRLRRTHPLTGYTPVPADGHLLAYLRGENVLAAATRLPHGLARDGGWCDATLRLPPGHWTDTLTDRTGLHGTVRIADLLSRPAPCAATPHVRAGGSWTHRPAPARPATASAWTTTRRCSPTPGRGASPTAPTDRHSWSTTPPSAGPRRPPRTRCPAAASTSCTSAPSPPRAPSRPPPPGWTTWSPSASTWSS